MFTITRNENGFGTGFTCNACGSTKVSKRYTHDMFGEVDGRSLSCTECKVTEGW